MIQAIQKYLEYLRSVRNSSPHTVLNYGKDLQQFAAYLSPPGEPVPAIDKIDHRVIREYVGYLHSQGLQKTSRRRGAIESFGSAAAAIRRQSGAVSKNAPARRSGF